MNKSIIYIIFGVFIIIGAITQFFVVRSRHLRDYSEDLTPILEKYGLIFKSSVFPGWFKIGPFPKFEVQIGRPQSSVPFLGKGEYNVYRIVTVSDAHGQGYKLWASLEFEVFRLRRIRWRVENADTIPEAVKSIIEE